MRPLSSSQKRLAHKWFVEGPLRPVAKAGFLGLLALELLAFRFMDRLKPPPARKDFGQLTALIKTFERSARCQALIDSIRRIYPELRIIVVDDSRQPVRYVGAITHCLPYDSGVAAGRSAGLALVETKYVLNLDDDFIFYQGTDLAGALALMEQYDEIDIMGGTVFDLPLLIRHDYRKGDLFPHDTKAILPARRRIGGLDVYDKVPNFFIARTKRLRLIDWDHNLKRIDHADFFTRAKGILVSVLNPDLDVLHVRNPFDSAYLEKRLDLSHDSAYLSAKYAKPWSGRPD